jgi:predicted nucleic acid-binding protein
MIILDTNVISELMRPLPDSNVMQWFSMLSGTAIYTTQITRAEILAGIALLPEGKRRNALQQAANAMFAEDFANRILPFDGRAAEQYARLIGSGLHHGGEIDNFDLLIAAITLAHRGTVATRNIRDFTNLGVKLVNPWDHAVTA